MTAWTGDHPQRLRFPFRTLETRPVFPSRPLAQGVRVSSSISTTGQRHLLHVWTQKSFPADVCLAHQPAATI